MTDVYIEEIEPWTCPRCNGEVFDLGDISITDDRTKICDQCVEDEDTERRWIGQVIPQSDWPVKVIHEAHI